MSYSGFDSLAVNIIRTVFRIDIVERHIMDESSVIKLDLKKSNSSCISSTADVTSSNVKIVDAFAFVRVKCEVEVSTVYFI